jgi:hypothetical protein
MPMLFTNQGNYAAYVYLSCFRCLTADLSRTIPSVDIRSRDTDVRIGTRGTDFAYVATYKISVDPPSAGRSRGLAAESSHFFWILLINKILFILFTMTLIARHRPPPSSLLQIQIDCRNRLQPGDFRAQL